MFFLTTISIFGKLTYFDWIIIKLSIRNLVNHILMLKEKCFKARITLLSIFGIFCCFFLQFFKTFDPPYRGKITKFYKDNNKSISRTPKSILLCSYFKQYMQNPNFFPHLLWNFTENFRHFLQRTSRTESNDLIMPTTIYSHIKNILEHVPR